MNNNDAANILARSAISDLREHLHLIGDEDDRAREWWPLMSAEIARVLDGLRPTDGEIEDAIDHLRSYEDDD